MVTTHSLLPNTRSTVVSVECSPALCSKIAASVALNSTLVHLVEVRNAFVGSKTLDTENTLALDDLASSTFVPDFMKIDIEGSESAALDGAA